MYQGAHQGIRPCANSINNTIKLFLNTETFLCEIIDKKYDINRARNEFEGNHKNSENFISLESSANEFETKQAF